MTTCDEIQTTGRLRRFTLMEPLALRVMRSLAAILVGIAAFFVGWAPAGASQNAAQALTRPGDVRSGTLLLKGDNTEGYADATRLGIDVDLTVSGPTIRARVTQIFRNPTEGWVEAVYVYPLPEGGAVDSLKMVIGDRVVIGDVKERKEARAIYEEAKAAGRKTTLVEQERPNLFTNSVANIGPGETVLVQIEYQEPVRQSAGTFSLRVPLVVAPRYNPKPVVQAVDFAPGGQGWGTAGNPVLERERIEPPVLDPRREAPTNPVSIAIRLQAGFPLGEVKSHHHDVRVEALGYDARVIKLADGPVPADRDFELTWKPAAASVPSVGLFRERVGDADYVLAFVTPPALQQAEDRRPREIVFVIDNSGSMGGTSMVQAKASLLYALGRLKPTDRFNVIRFDHTMDVLFPDAVRADAEQVRRAEGFVGALQAQGGTEMLPAMKAALTDPRQADSGFLRQIVFLTDGAIGNEQQLLDTIATQRGRSRVFMVGIGSAPNSFLMTRAAEIGRGTFTHIGSADQVEDHMRSLFDKLESPALTNLSARFSEGEADVTPAVLPDLYRGEPLVIAARVGSAKGTLAINGRIGESPWAITLPLANATQGKGLSKLWARRKIADAEVARTLRRATLEEADKTILTLALDHRLVTRLTSLVAVDKTPSRPEGARLTRADLPLNLPAGWEFEKVFGGEKTRDERAPRMDRAGTSRIQVASAGGASVVGPALARSAAAAPSGLTLPATATDSELRMMLGLLLCAASLLLVVICRRRVAA
jgi:Ca-activated chloride channel homolog